MEIARDSIRLLHPDSWDPVTLNAAFPGSEYFAQSEGNVLELDFPHSSNPNFHGQLWANREKRQLTCVKILRVYVYKKIKCPRFLMCIISVFCC